MQNANEQTMTRYYFWEFTKPYGWRQICRMDGYATIKELKENCAFYMKGEHKSDGWRIMKAEVIESKEPNLNQ